MSEPFSGPGFPALCQDLYGLWSDMLGSGGRPGRRHVETELGTVELSLRLTKPRPKAKPPEEDEEED